MIYSKFFFVLRSNFVSQIIHLFVNILEEAGIPTFPEGEMEMLSQNQSSDYDVSEEPESLDMSVTEAPVSFLDEDEVTRACLEVYSFTQSTYALVIIFSE